MFKVGDKVKITDCPEGNHKIGMIGKVTVVDNDDKTFLVNCNKQSWWYCEEDLKFTSRFPVNFQTGMVVTRRDGIKSVFIKDPCSCNRESDVFINLDNGYHMMLSDYTDDFKEKYGKDDFDIMKIEKPKHIGNIFSKEDDNSEVLWERENPKLTALKEKQKEVENAIRDARQNLKAIQEEIESGKFN